MINISGFQAREKIFESESTLVYRACRIFDKLPVILKVLKSDYPDPFLLSRWRNEYNILSLLDSDKVIRVYGLEKYEKTLVLVVEDCGFTPLDAFISDKETSLSFSELLHIAINIVDLIKPLHEAGIIHKDINPSNILYDPESGRVKIIDLAVASMHSLEDTDTKNVHALEGTIAYMSPEQTGRTSRTLDLRTDFYSLGVTLYELFCGRLPFQSSDSLELVHSHIAEEPLHPQRLNEKFPKVLAEIILKLMAKNAEDRYQSLGGIRFDLLECEKQMAAFGTIKDFPLARQDTFSTLRISQKLYGRSAEIASLMWAFGRAADGGHEILMVSGYTGSGKTSLVREVYKPILMKRGLFISGRFEKLLRDTPYRALREALAELVAFILTEDEVSLSDWRRKILSAIGTNGAILLEIAPEFEKIIGKQAKAAKLAPAEAQNRFNFVVKNFLRALVDSERPLVLFLDDLQWADKPSLDLLASLSMDTLLTHLFIIGAYRENEVPSGHPLAHTLKSLRKQGVVVEEIHLAPLSTHDINIFVADSIGADPVDVEPLALMVGQKTAGNPFFVGLFLQSLASENILFFDSSLGKWRWDLDRIRSVQVFDSAADLLAVKIEHFSEETRAILEIASCIGSDFDVLTVQAVCQRKSSEIIACIRQATSEGLVVYVGLSPADPLALSVSGESVNLEYRFYHDRIQMVVYSMISAQKRAVYHQAIGKFLLSKTSELLFDEHIFDIVNQFNLGRELIDGESEKKALATLNLEASQKAKSSAAWEATYGHAKIGLEIICGSGWQDYFDLSLALHTEAAEASYLCGRYEEMEEIFQVIIAHARSPLDMEKAYEIKIQACKAQYKLLEAVEIALPVLKLLGENFPDKPNIAHNIFDLTSTKILLAGRKIESLIDLPEMVSPEKRAVLRIIASVGSAAYFACPKLMPLLVYHGVQLSIKHGNAPESAFLYAVYGMINCAVLGNISQGNSFGRLALRLLDKFEALPLKAKTLHMVNVFIRHWQCPLEDTLEPLEEGFQSGLETGDFEYAGFCAYFYCFHSFWVGSELGDLQKQVDKYAGVIKGLKHETSMYSHAILQQAVANLTGEGDEPWQLHGQFYNEKRMLPVLEKARDQATLFSYYFTTFFLSYFFGKYHQAESNSGRAEANLDGALGMIGVGLFHYYQALNNLTLCSFWDESATKTAIKKVLAVQHKMETWSKNAPGTYKQKVLIIEAELMRVQGINNEAGIIYDKAIASAHLNKNLLDEALANELAAKFYLDQERPSIGRSYMLAARFCYQRWGGSAKVKFLDKNYSQLLILNLPISTTPSLGNAASLSTTLYDTDFRLDFASVMKASHAISGEIVFDGFIRKMMRIVIENAGAQYGVFIRKIDGKLKIEAEGTFEEDMPITLRSVSLEEGQVPVSVINYAARTSEHVVLADAANEGHFANDSYIIEKKVKSVLCVPVLHKADLRAIIYLENNLVAGVFTTRRLETLRVLCSQIAISLENATLFAGLTESESRYRELFENIIDMVVLIDEQGYITMANPLFYSVIEREQDGPGILSFKDYVHSDDFFLVKDKIYNALKEGKVVKNVGFRMRSPSNEYSVECSAKNMSKEQRFGGYQMVIRDVTERKKLEKELFVSLQDAQNARVGTILGLAKLAEFRDKETGRHLERMREYCRVLAEELARKPDYANYLSAKYIEDIYLSSILHDIGKVGVPDHILLKPGKLNEAEFEIIKKHSSYGGDALATVEAQTTGPSFLSLGKTIAYHHHEKWDGSGYPDGLEGDEIPLSTRIVALADVYDALTSIRCYKEACTHDYALKTIYEAKGRHFAPDVVDAFLDVEARFLAIGSELRH